GRECAVVLPAWWLRVELPSPGVGAPGEPNEAGPPDGGSPHGGPQGCDRPWSRTDWRRFWSGRRLGVECLVRGHRRTQGHAWSAVASPLGRLLDDRHRAAASLRA